MSVRLSISNFYTKMMVKPFLKKNNDPTRVRQWLENQAKFFFSTPRGFWHRSTSFLAEGRIVKGLWVGCGNDNTDEGVLLYIHGGAFIFGSPTTHMKLAARIAGDLNFKAALPDYRLAPEHKYPDALIDVITTYKAILGNGIPSNQIILAGDSAGGTLVLQLLNYILKEQLDIPSAAILLSPLTDLTFSSNSILENEKEEVILPVEQIGFMKEAYLGSTDPTTISPIFFEYKGSCPILIHVSASEILLDDSINLHKKLLANDVNVTIDIEKNTPHVWHLLYGYFPEAKASLSKISKFLQECLIKKPLNKS